MSITYNDIKRSGERNDCTVKAVSISCNKSYDFAHKACAKLGRKSGKGMKAGVVLNVIESLGFQCVPVTLGSKYTARTITDACDIDNNYVAFVIAKT
jgi:hypothetical protein